MPGNPMVLIWIFFMAVFFYLSYAHWQNTRQSIRPFHLHEEEGESKNEFITRFVEDFNNYLEKYNRSTKSQNQAAAIGYLFAGIAALISSILMAGGG
jgi:ABC-type phosphate/phosphonate transport system permease subunit